MLFSSFQETSLTTCTHTQISSEDISKISVLCWLTYFRYLKNLAGITEGIFHAEWSQRVSVTYTLDKKTDRGRLACLHQCQSMLGPVFSHWALSPKYVPLVTIVSPVCLLADTSNNPDIWPASKLITTLDGIDPSSRGFPSRAVCFCSLLLLSFIWLLCSWLLFSLSSLSMSLTLFLYSHLVLVICWLH